ncbi:BQ2448_697 [Microbotryum intermedium]|uniref:BQ2448_697 protein n=1 Tax=Microbotryum intermedium TaxID=269621 RepID=A0A238FBX6_9BASI|nr:BQ2448_697 [Microbotryum intermedium]
MENRLRRTLITIELRHVESYELIKRFSGERGQCELGRGGHRADPTELGLSTGLFRREGTQVMSAKHAMIRWKATVMLSDETPGFLREDTLVEIMDLGSTNGTGLRRRGESGATRLRPQEPHRLRDGDVLTFGRQLVTDGDKDVHRPLALKVKIIESEIGVGEPAGDQGRAGASIVDGRGSVANSPGTTQCMLGHGQRGDSAQVNSDTESDQHGSGVEEDEETMVNAPQAPSSRQPHGGYGLTEEQLVLHDEESNAAKDMASSATSDASSKLGMTLSAIDLTKEESGSDRDSMRSDPQSVMFDKGSKASGMQQSHVSDRVKVAKQELGIVMFSDETMDECEDDNAKCSDNYVTKGGDKHSKKSDGNESSRSDDSDPSLPPSSEDDHSDDEDSDEDVSNSVSDVDYSDDGAHLLCLCDRSSPCNSDCEDAPSRIDNAPNPTQRGKSGAIRVDGDGRRRVVLSSDDEEENDSMSQSSSRGVTTPPSSSVVKRSSPLQSPSQQDSFAVDDGEDSGSRFEFASDFESEEAVYQEKQRSSPSPFASDDESDLASEHEADQDVENVFSGITCGSLALNTHAKNLKASLEAIDRALVPLLKRLSDKKFAEDVADAVSGPDTSGGVIVASANATASFEPTIPSEDTSVMDGPVQASPMGPNTEITVAPSTEVVAPYKVPRFVRGASVDAQAAERARCESLGPLSPFAPSPPISDDDVDPDLDEIDSFAEDVGETESDSKTAEHVHCYMDTKSYDTPWRIFEGIGVKDIGAAHKPSKVDEHIQVFEGEFLCGTDPEVVRQSPSKKRLFSAVEASDETELQASDGHDITTATLSSSIAVGSEAVTTAGQTPPQSMASASDESAPPATKRRRVSLRDVSLGFGVGVVATLWGLTAMSESFLQSIIE